MEVERQPTYSSQSTRTSRSSKINTRSVRLVSMADLTPRELLAWEAIRSTREEFATPFFSARFSHAVQMSRGDVDVAIIQDGEQSIGFLPFHRVKNIAVPVGRCLNDAHNIIAERTTQIDWLWLLKQMNVKAFDFHALMGADLKRLGQKNYIGTIQSFCANLGDDSEGFLDRLCQQHKTIRRQPQKTRKMSREVGPVSVEVDCQSMELLEQTIQWTREQYQRTTILDFFTPNWTRDLVRNMFLASEVMSELPGSARGLLSVLRAGDNVVAAHYGILEGDLLHYWFPAYDPRFGRYSPGTALFRHIVSSASEYGIRSIDMGYGEQPYKRKQTDTLSKVAYGCLTDSSLYRRRRSLEATVTAVIKQAPMKETLKRIWRRVQPNAGISKLQ